MGREYLRILKAFFVVSVGSVDRGGVLLDVRLVVDCCLKAKCDVVVVVVDLSSNVNCLDFFFTFVVALINCFDLNFGVNVDN